MIFMSDKLWFAFRPLEIFRGVEKGCEKDREIERERREGRWPSRNSLGLHRMWLQMKEPHDISSQLLSPREGV